MLKLALFLPILITVINAGTDLVPEAEFCEWLFDHCPYIKSPYRPVKHPFFKVDVEIKLGARRLTKLDDVEQKFEFKIYNLNKLFFFVFAKISFEVIGMFDFYWLPKMDCLENITEDIQNAPISEAAKSTFTCQVDKKETWIPKIRHSNAVKDANYFTE